MFTDEELGFQKTREQGNSNAPLLEEEMAKFEGEVDAGGSYSRYGPREIISMVTPHGKKKIKEALEFRILNDDLPMTLLWHNDGDYGEHMTPEPMFQRDKVSPPVEEQHGGWYMCKNSKELRQIPDFYEWNSCGMKKDKNGKSVRLENGDLCSIATHTWTKGFYTVLPHYRPESYGQNKYKGDVKSAILASCLSDDDKQELLDLHYRINDPVRKLDSYFLRKVQNWCCEGKGDQKLIEEEIRLCKDLPEPVRENLLINLGVLEYKDSKYYNKD